MITRAGLRRWADALRWSAAALVIAAAHAGVGWVVLKWEQASAEAVAGAPEPAIMIELAAVSIAPEAPAEPLPPAPERVEPETPLEPVKEPPPPEPEPQPPEPIVQPPVEPPPAEPLPESTPVQAPEPEIRLPELPAIPDAPAVLAPPPPTLPPQRPKEIAEPPQRKPPPKPRRVERQPVERPRQRQAVAPPSAPPQASAANPASSGATSQPSVSTANWRGALIAHLNRYKRFPGGAQPGTVQVAFTIDRSGNVLSARLAGSSGDPALDAEAIAMIRRASPVPAPPSGLGGGTIALAVPVRFSR
jgi:protein TonB